MKPAVAVLAPQPAVAAGKMLEGCSILNFSFGAHRLSPLHLLDSTFASPGRYAAEMLLRLQRHAPSPDGHLIVNPRYAPSAESIHALVDVARAQPAAQEVTVIADRQGRAAATFFRKQVAAEDLLTLSAQSALDPELDCKFLSAAFGWRGKVAAAKHADTGSPFGNGFLEGSLEESAARLPSTLVLEALGAGTERRALRQIAVLPYHAGDLLFLAQALQANPSLDTVVTLREFAPIAEEALPWTRIISVDAATHSRGGYWVQSEQAHLVEIIKKARAAAARNGQPLDGVFHLFRPHRDMSHSHFHLRQQLYFAIGADCEKEADVWPQGRAQRRGAATGKSVVLHFDGGWELKGYPQKLRPQLVALLRDAGYSPILLGKPDVALDGIPAVPFQSLSQLRALYADAAAVIGVDSFPAHYGVHYGVPTVHLFASTHPRNSDYPESPISAVSHHDMPCVPCGQPTYCKLDGGTSCRAIESPHQVLARLSAIIREFTISPLSIGLAQRYASDYRSAGELIEYARRFSRSGTALVVDCGLGAAVRKLQEEGHRAAGVTLGADPSLPRRYSGVRIEREIPVNEKFDLIISLGDHPPAAVLSRSLAEDGVLILTESQGAGLQIIDSDQSHRRIAAKPGAKP